jgi:hypothetical protein
MRLTHENKQLKSKQSDVCDNRLVLIQTLYDDEKSRSKDLQNRLDEANRQKFELEHQLTTSSSSSGFMSMSASNNNLSALMSSPEAGGEDGAKRNQFTIIKQMEDRIKALMFENNTLKDSVEKERNIKLREVYEVEEKYRGYLEKAKFVIKSLDPTKTSLNTDQDSLVSSPVSGGANGSAPTTPQPSTNEIELLKTQLAERDRQIKQLAVSILFIL